MSSGRLGELLVRENLISVQQLRKAQEEQRQNGTRIGAALIKTGAIEESKLTEFLSKQYGVPAINLKDFDIDPDVIKLVTKEVALKHVVLPVNRAGPALIVAMADPSNIFAQDDLKFLTGYNIEPVVASEVAIREAIEKYYAEKQQSLEDIVGEVEADEDVEVSREEEENVNEMAKAADDAPVVKLVNLILLDAIKKGASDIHVEPYEKDFRVRFRIDGNLYEVMRPPMKLKNAITSRLKIMADLDISERRLPQDGRIKIKMGGGKEMDYRVSVCPTLFGEKVVLRLLDKSNLQLDMTKLGFEAQPLAWFKEAIERPYGMVLVTGPTGSGKTTTLYSALSSLNTTDTNLATAEDPVEFNFAGINQVQMKDDIGLNFAAALRSFLRQDPDIIMIGEIRDFETAEIGVKAALTGHLVLSTLHTNDAPTTLTRLRNMGVAPFNIASSVVLITAQRLARRLCAKCKKEVELPRNTLLEAGITEDEIDGSWKPYQPVGCAACNNGYKGRVGIYQVMPITEELQRIILRDGSSMEIAAQSEREGVRSLRRAALNKFKMGLTSLEEVVAVTNE